MSVRTERWVVEEESGVTVLWSQVWLQLLLHLYNPNPPPSDNAQRCAFASFTLFSKTFSVTEGSDAGVRTYSAGRLKGSCGRMQREKESGEVRAVGSRCIDKSVVGMF